MRSLMSMHAWTITIRDGSQKKKRRERATLDCRTARGASTATDAVWKSVQLLQADTAALLELVEQRVRSTGRDDHV